MLIGNDLGATGITIFLFHLEQLILHHLLAQFGITQDLLIVSDQLLYLLIFLVQLVDTQTGELTQTHVYDSLALQLVQLEALLQVTLCIRRGLTVADDVHHLIDIIAGDDQSLKDMSTLLGFLQVVFRTTDSHVMTVLHEVLHTLLQGEQARTTLHQCDIVHREAALQGRHLEQLIQDHVGIGVFLHIDDDAHTLTTGLIVSIADTLEFTFFHQVDDIFNQLLFVAAVRNLCNHNLVMTLMTLDLCLSTHDNPTTTGLVSILHALQTIDKGACREVGSRNILHQSFGIDIGIVDVGTTAIDHLTQIVCRHIGSHTHGDTITTIDQQVRNLRRHHGWLLQRVVEVILHIHGILLQVVHDMLSHLRQTALGITHGSC